MSKNRKQTWIALLAVAVLVPIVVLVGVVTFVNVAETPFHPDPLALTSISRSAPAAPWANAVQASRKLVRDGVTEQYLPGISVAVGVDGDIVWAEAFGWSDVEKQVPFTPETRTRIGHTSVALTSAGVGLLLEKGRLHLDDEIQRHVPAFPKKQWPVTLRQLMGHVAGVRHYRDTEWGDDPQRTCARASEGVSSFFAGEPLLFEPETQYGYSTYGWVLVSAAVEAAASETFFSFMRSAIFEPLGMAGTTADSASEAMPNRAVPYYRARMSQLQTAGEVDYSCFAGAGGFLSTPSDLVRFGMALGHGKLLQSTTVKQLQAPQQLASGKQTDYGLGWTLETYPLAGKPTRLASHSGRILLGGSTSFLTFPERGLVVAVTTNMSLKDMRSLALRIADTFEAVR